MPPRMDVDEFAEFLRGIGIEPMRLRCINRETKPGPCVHVPIYIYLSTYRPCTYATATIMKGNEQYLLVVIWNSDP